MLWLKLVCSFAMDPLMSESNPGAIRVVLASAILILCVGCDQATKHLASQTLQNGPRQSYLADTVRLEYALNPGGFLSLGSHLSESVRTWLFVGFNVAMMLALSVYLVINRQLPFAFFASAVFVIAGGVGNLIDRVANKGLVTDFINLGIGPVRTGIFNVADMAVTFGVIALLIQSFRQDRAEAATPRDLCH